MTRMTRYALYYAPRRGGFAEAAARWLGWDIQRGCTLPQPAIAGLDSDTAAPRRYGFHGTIKPPFRLAEGVSPDDLAQAVQQLAARLRMVEMPGLMLVTLSGFLALVPRGDTAAMQALAAQVVRHLEPFRAALTPDEVARRRPDHLTPRQADLLAQYGYPFVMEEFSFHLTLTGPLPPPRATLLEPLARAHFDGVMPQPFRVADLCLCGEAPGGQFSVLHRYALSA